MAFRELEQPPPYTALPQPGLTPANGGNHALLTQLYVFPTSFKVGKVFTDEPLVNINQTKGHLALLNAFSNLKARVDGLSPGSIYNMPGNQEKRWAWFVGLAAERCVDLCRCDIYFNVASADYRIGSRGGLAP
jgi:hypothetical protein